MEHNEEHFPHKVVGLDGVQQEIFEEGETMSLSEEMLDQEALDIINMQLVSETDPIKKAELEAQAKELEEKLGLETEHQLAA